MNDPAGNQPLPLYLVGYVLYVLIRGLYYAVLPFALAGLYVAKLWVKS